MAPPPDTTNYDLVSDFPDLETDINEMANVIVEALETDPIWSVACKDVTKDDQRKWHASYLWPRFRHRGIKVFAIREKSTGKIRAWTGLAYPMILTPEQEAARDADNEFDTKPPKGLNKDFFALFQNYRGSSKKFGYDSTTHFHRKGTFTSTAYQRKGLGSWLTSHCNAIADAEGAATYLGAQAASLHMFETEGFKVLGTTDSSHLGLYGVERVDETVFMRREPQLLT